MRNRCGAPNQLPAMGVSRSWLPLLVRAYSASPPLLHVAAAAKGRVRPAVLTYRVRRAQTVSHTTKKHKVSAPSHRPGKKTRHRPRQNLKIRAQSAA